LAGETQAAFLPIGPSDVLSKFVGESEASIRSLFVKAVQMGREMESNCAVIFFDEIDALGQSRSSSRASGNLSPIGSDYGGPTGGMDTCSRRVLAELLIQLTRINDLNGHLSIEDFEATTNSDGDDRQDRNINYGMNPFAGGGEDPEPFHSTDDETGVSHGYNGTQPDETDGLGSRSNKEKLAKDGVQNLVEGTQETRVIVVAATNRPEDCDPALIRRFSVRALVGLPEERDRIRILKRYLEGIEHRLSKQDFSRLANATEEWSGSDLECLTRDAAMAPVRECIRSAALLKRRKQGLRRQTGKHSSFRAGQASQKCIDEEQIDRFQQFQLTLSREFQELRPVTIEDFMEAMTIWMGHKNFRPGTPETKHFFCTNQGENKHVHYDTSSDEDDSCSEGRPTNALVPCGSVEIDSSK
jgi:SpoVK/Ycf46/Vps4 family AAA+-type ATPase